MNKLTQYDQPLSDYEALETPLVPYEVRDEHFSQQQLDGEFLYFYKRWKAEHPKVEVAESFAKNAQLKFVAVRGFQAGLKKGILRFFSEPHQHIWAFEEAEAHLERTKPVFFVGAGIIKEEGRLRWESYTCSSTIGRDAPTTPLAREREEASIREAYQSWVQAQVLRLLALE